MDGGLWNTKSIRWYEMTKISIPKRDGKKLILFTAGKTHHDIMEFMQKIETMVKDPKIKCVCVDAHMVKSWCYVDETTIIEMKNETSKIEPKPMPTLYNDWLNQAKQAQMEMEKNHEPKTNL